MIGQEFVEPMLYGLELYLLINNWRTLGYYRSWAKNREKDNSANPEKYPDLEPNFISIIVPALREEKVIGRTIEHLQKVDYPKDKYEILLATYESDKPTRDVVHEKMKLYPNVHEALNEKPFPSNKAKNVNNAFGYLDKETKIVGFQDAEDVISTDIFRNANCLLYGEEEDAVQFEVLPEKGERTLTGRSYDLMFVKGHRFILKERQNMGYPVPFAGVGMYLKKDTLDEMMRLDGYLLDEGNLTEDLELAVRMHRHGYKIRFCNASPTREKFPDDFSRAMKQRTRWTLGTLQTIDKHELRNMGEYIKNFIRRKKGFDYSALSSGLWGPITGIGAYLLVAGLTNQDIIEQYSALWYLAALNTVGASEDLFVTPYLAMKEYGGGPAEYSKYVASSILNNYLNFRAVISASGKYLENKVTGKAPEWYKTPR